MKIKIKIIKLSLKLWKIKQLKHTVIYKRRNEHQQMEISSSWTYNMTIIRRWLCIPIVSVPSIIVLKE